MRPPRAGSSLSSDLRDISERDGRPVMITGGAGFIGSNLADRLLGAGENVLVYDNLSRSGTERNMSWLEERHGERVRFNVADISDCAALERAVRGASMVYHFAAQVAVTTSVADPIRDFESNMRGTLNLLEAIRSLKDPPPLVYTSTNKVYGALEDVVLNRKGTRYEPADVAVHVRGIAESRPLGFTALMDVPRALQINMSLTTPGYTASRPSFSA